MKTEHRPVTSPGGASTPYVSFFRSTASGLTPIHEPDLDERLPLARPGLLRDESSRMTYRDYFHAIERVVREHWPDIVDAGAHAAMPCPDRIREVRIIGEKHGSDYHPARVALVCPDRTYSLVMNVALTARGMERIAREFGVLHSLSARPGQRFVPKVYFLAEEVTPPDRDSQVTSSMFLGEWLDGYHEFHLTAGSEKGAYETVLWDAADTSRLLSRQSASEIVRQAAFILTWYYDPVTFDEIYPWHHAAGDFVARVQDDGISVRLVAARQYGSRIVFSSAATVDPNDAALVYFANLTLRNRLDRLDGVGEVVFAGEHCVEATVRGFFAALHAKASDGWCSSDFPERFARLAGGLSPADWADVFRVVVDSFDPDAPDLPVIMAHLADHVFQVYRLAQVLT